MFATCSCTCIGAVLSGMVPHGPRGIFRPCHKRSEGMTHPTLTGKVGPGREILIHFDIVNQTKPNFQGATGTVPELCSLAASAWSYMGASAWSDTIPSFTQHLTDLVGDNLLFSFVISYISLFDQIQSTLCGTPTSLWCPVLSMQDPLP